MKMTYAKTQSTSPVYIHAGVNVRARKDPILSAGINNLTVHDLAGLDRSQQPKNPTAIGARKDFYPKAPQHAVPPTYRSAELRDATCRGDAAP